MLLLLSLTTFASVVLLTVGLAPHISNFWGEVRRAYQTEGMVSSDIPDILRLIYPLLKVLARYNKSFHLARRKEKLMELLRQAGAPIEIQADELIGICELSAAASLVLATLLLKGLLGMSFYFCLAIGVGGFFIPVLWLSSYVENRLLSVHRQMPYMVDLLVMSMEAGSSFLEALSIYIQDNRKDELAEEFSYFISEMNLGKTRREALTHLADRVGSEEVRSFALTITQGEEMGTPLGALLRIYADGMRLKRSQRAEKMAGEAAVKILGPSMLMMIAVVLLVLGPILIKYVRGELIF